MHNSREFNWMEAITWSEEFLKDFNKAASNNNGNLVVNVPQQLHKWVPPAEGMYKANCGVFVNKSKRRIGIGIVIRNHNGNIMASCSQALDANLSLKAAKLTAVLRSILFSRDCGLAPCLVEVLEATVVRWIVNGSYRQSEFGVILNDIDSLL
ncbi:hypothetical protein Q3G72_016433 [Acer saccharum]|nr:hypothetical protein Q3G72_016433 [Acer saccharum]